MVPPADDEEHGRPLRQDAPQQAHGVKSESSAEGDTHEKASASDRNKNEAVLTTGGVEKKGTLARLTAVEGPPIEGAWYVQIAPLLSSC